MSARRILGPMLLIVAASCAQQTQARARQPLAPEDGPRAWIHTSYSGDVFFRTVNAVFRVDEAAYVIVAHLSGEGVIRVLYPESPREFGYVPGKKTRQTGQFSAHYDAAPALYTFTANPFRGLGAAMDSYDGRGHGYVFMIATRTPMYLGQVADRAGWLDVEIVDYQQTHDPRFAIRDYAEAIAGSEPFTLKFARSFTSQSFTSYATAAWECALLSSYGMGSSYGLWGAWGAPRWSFGHSDWPYSRLTNCGSHRGSHYYASYDGGWTDVGPRVPGTTTPAPRPLTPRLARPGYRPITERSPAVLVTRSALDRSNPTTRGPGQRGRETDSRRRATADEVGSRPWPSPGSRPWPSRGSTDDTRSARPRETTPAERPRATETSRPVEISRPAPERARPAEQPRSQETPRASAPSETRSSPPPTPEKPSGG